MTNMEAIHTFTNKTKNEIFEVFYDEDPSSPREWDNLGKIYAEHRNYDLCDKDANKEEARQAFKDAVCLPLYLYDHSGLWLSTSNSTYPFNDRWDSCQVGYIYATKEHIKKEYGVKRISKQLKAKVEKILNGEIQEFSQYLNGEVYGFVHSKLEKCDHDHTHKEHINSCWGYYAMSPQEILETEIPKTEIKDWNDD